jgi:hypothetical protein
VLFRSDKPVSSYEFAYDDKGNQISRIVNSDSGAKMAETVYKYDEEGLAISSETLTGSGQKISSTKSQYNSEGKLLNEIALNAEGQVTAAINIIWENGREARNEHTDADGIVQMRITNEYGDQGELIRKTVDHHLQGDVKQIFEYEYEFKPVGSKN